jgi:hypothetical protein
MNRIAELLYEPRGRGVDDPGMNRHEVVTSEIPVRTWFIRFHEADVFLSSFFTIFSSQWMLILLESGIRDFEFYKPRDRYKYRLFFGNFASNSPTFNNNNLTPHLARVK